MVGIYGTIGTSDEFDKVREHFFFTGNEYPTKYKDNDRSIHATFHQKEEAESQPVQHKDSHLLIWGEICGYGDLNEYESRKDIAKNLTDAEYCSKLYEKYGIDFIKKLNSNFAGVIIDSGNQKTHLFTDWLSSRPLYYIKTSDNSLIFSTSVQAVARHSDYDIQFEKEFLCEYLTVYNALGIHTPLKKIKQLHPGSILTFDQKTGEIEEKIYWKIEYNPLDRDFKFFVEWFDKILDDVMYNRLDDDKDYGLMLSGGTDSRIIANYLEGETFFHMNETMNREAKLAKKVSKLTSNKFEFLKREKEYVPKSLQKVTPLMNFNSSFEHAHSIGFSQELQNVDIILSGHFADNLLLGLYIPKKKVELPFSYPLKLLFENTLPKKIDSMEEFIEYIGNKKPDYLNFDFQLRESIELSYEIQNRNNEKTNLKGVFYPNLESVNHYWKTYPMTNSTGNLFYESLNQIGITSTPFIDNRMIEFSQYLPIKYKIRRGIVKNALHQKNRKLSKIINPHSLQPTYRHELIHNLFQSLHSFLNHFKNHMEDEGSWPDHAKIMRETGYAEKNIRDNKDIFDRFDYLDYENALAQINNDDYHSIRQIFSLLSFLEIYNKIKQ